MNGSGSAPNLGAASPIHGAGVLGLDPSGIRIRRQSRGMIRALLLVHSLGVGWRGEGPGEPHPGNEQSGAEISQLEPRHGGSPTCWGHRTLEYRAFGQQRPARLDHTSVSPHVIRVREGGRGNSRSRLPEIAGAYGATSSCRSASPAAAAAGLQKVLARDPRSPPVPLK